MKVNEYLSYFTGGKKHKFEDFKVLMQKIINKVQVMKDDIFGR